MTSVQDPRTKNDLAILSSLMTSCWPRKWPLCRILEQKMIYLYCPHEWHHADLANDLCAGSSNSKLKRDQEMSNNGLLQKKVCTMYKYSIFFTMSFFFMETDTLRLEKTEFLKFFLLKIRRSYISVQISGLLLYLCTSLFKILPVSCCHSDKFCIPILYVLI